MSANPYSRSGMIKLARSLNDEELARSASIASKEGHVCSHCFHCVCKEVLQQREDFGRDLAACTDLLKEKRIEEVDKLAKEYRLSIDSGELADHLILP